MIDQSRRNLLAMFAVASAASALPKSVALADHGDLVVPSFDETGRLLASREAIERLILDLQRVWRFACFAFLHQHRDNPDVFGQAQNELANFKDRPPIVHVLNLLRVEVRETVARNLASLSQEQQAGLVSESNNARQIAQLSREIFVSTLRLRPNDAEVVDALQSIVHADRIERLSPGRASDGESSWCNNLYFRWICEILS